MKKSAFDLDNQITSIDSKIVASLERISEAFRVLLWNEGKQYSLSPIQIQVLIFLLHHADEKRKVSYLAAEFNMTKATISETIKSLEKKLLIEKSFEPHDTRSYIIHLTKKGKEMAHKTSLFTKQIQTPITTLPLADKIMMLNNLLSIIHYLNKSGVISIQRMCFSCQHYKGNYKGQDHFCSLLNTKLENEELRIDCMEHSFKDAV